MHLVPDIRSRVGLRRILQVLGFPALIFITAFTTRIVHLDRLPCFVDEIVYIRSGILFISLILKARFFDRKWWYGIDVPPVGCYLIGLGLRLSGVPFRGMHLQDLFNLRSGTIFPLWGPWMRSPGLRFNLEMEKRVILVARTTTALFSSLSCVAFYYLGKDLRNRKFGLLSAAIWMFNPVSILLGRIAILESFMAFFLIMSIFCFFQCIRLQSLRYLVLGGVLFGLAAGSKMFGWLEFPILLLWLILSKLGASHR
jgi:dolichyl-phosphate-mannose--protein O-mannosyl transferase